MYTAIDFGAGLSLNVPFQARNKRIFLFTIAIITVLFYSCSKSAGDKPKPINDQVLKTVKYSIGQIDIVRSGKRMFAYITVPDSTKLHQYDATIGFEEKKLGTTYFFDTKPGRKNTASLFRCRDVIHLSMFHFGNWLMKCHHRQ